ncbi:GIY-YIG nuclease family protein [Clavibacter sp. Sh2126]|uniref:GIY-YIG nuclease family protein n=1 Tax=Clavibacter sp. Sh2126 TaxID=3397678 RepID=UPI0039E0C93E
MPIPLHPLTFTRYDMTEGGSAAALFADSSEVSGIYVLEFEDEMRYVGQTREIVARYATHRRHHGDIVALSFAPCAVADLDEHERQEIRRQEARHGLRNLSLTGRPAGEGDLEVFVENGESVLLPWDRERRLRLSEEGEHTQQRRFWDLARRPDYDAMADALAMYIDECIPDPFGTQRVLWTIAALPTTSRRSHRRRLFTLSCGGRETLFAHEVRDGKSSRLEICLNVDGERVRESQSTSAGHAFAASVLLRLEEVAYGDEIVHRKAMHSWSQLEWVISRSQIVEGAYRLNTMLMRRRAPPYRRHHNQPFADDLLRRAELRSRSTSPTGCSGSLLTPGAR